MGIPKKTKSKPLADKTQEIKAAIETATKGSKKNSTSNKTEKKQAVKTKKIGRPPLAGNRSTRITTFMSKETKDRFEIAFLHEQLKRRKSGGKIDKSLLVEEAIKTFLDNNDY